MRVLLVCFVFAVCAETATGTSFTHTTAKDKHLKERRDLQARLTEREKHRLKGRVEKSLMQSMVEQLDSEGNEKVPDGDLDLGDREDLAGSRSRREQRGTDRLAEAIGSELAQAPESVDTEEITGNMNVQGTLSARNIVARDRLQAGGITARTLTPAVMPSGNVGPFVPGTGSNNDLYMLSAMHCFWNGDKLVGCPNEKTSWEGLANFIAENAVVSSDDPMSLRIPFEAAYSGRPMCTFSFQDVAVMVKSKARASYVDLAIFKEGGCETQWSEVQTWLTVICHGTRSPPVEDASPDPNPTVDTPTPNNEGSDGNMTQEAY